jgi:hypothetical protein
LHAQQLLHAVAHILERQKIDVVDASRCVVIALTIRRPRGHHEQMRRQTPRRGRFEHVILQDEIVGICPIVRNVPAVVITHHVIFACSGAVWSHRVGAAFGLRFEQAQIKPVHPAVIDV